MRYKDVLICEENVFDRRVFSKTLADCYVSYCSGFDELNELLNGNAYDAIFLGRSAIIQILDQSAVLEKLVEVEIPEGLFMFMVSEELKIQVKKISLNRSFHVESADPFIT
jgi:hypothetical protein